MRRSPMFLLSVLMLIVVTDAVPLYSHSINWDVVPTAVQRRNLESTELGQCMCDLHRFACDLNCCCDPDCEDESNQFDRCAREVHSNGRAESCFTKNSVTEVIRGRQVEEREDWTHGAYDAVCVYRDNYPHERARFFAVPGSLAATDITAPPIRDWKADSPSLQFGGPITLLRAFQRPSSGWLIREAGRGVLAAPTAGPGGVCRDDVALLFPTPLTRRSCFLTRLGRDTSMNMCAMASVDVYRNLALGTAGSTIGGFSDVAPVRLVVVDFSSGVILEASSPDELFRAILESAPQPSPSPTNEGDPVNSNRRQLASMPEQACVDAVRKIEMLIEYDVNPVPRIVNATVTAFVDTSGSVLNTTGRLKQEFHFSIQRRGIGGLPRRRSGNPGYIAGSQVLAGTVVQNGDKAAIKERVSGLAIPFGLHCDEKKFKSVRFLHDVLNSGCFIELTEAAFEDMCLQQESADLVRRTLTPQVEAPTPSSLFNGSVSFLDRVGRTGDAHPLDPASWVEVAGGLETTATPRLAAIRRTCESLVIGAQYVIVVGRAGAEFNPQDVILGVKLEPIVGSWTFRQEGVGAAERFWLQFRVRFVRHEESGTAREARRVVPPPILPPMDDNIFYPFRRPGRQTDPGTDG